MTATTQPSWRTAFRRSARNPFVYYSSDYALAAVVEPCSQSSGMFGHSIQSTPLLDGLVTRTASYGFGPYLSDGWHIIGHRPLRWLCDALDLRPPRRLKGEPEIDDIEELRAALEWQRTWPHERLARQNGLGASTIVAREVDAIVWALQAEGGLITRFDWWRAHALDDLFVGRSAIGEDATLQRIRFWTSKPDPSKIQRLCNWVARDIRVAPRDVQAVADTEVSQMVAQGLIEATADRWLPGAVTHSHQDPVVINFAKVEHDAHQRAGVSNAQHIRSAITSYLWFERLESEGALAEPYTDMLTVES